MDSSKDAAKEEEQKSKENSFRQTGIVKSHKGNGKRDAPTLT